MNLTLAKSILWFFILFFALNPLFSQVWFSPIEDKIWFAFFSVLILLLRTRDWLLTLGLALFAALKGLGLPIMVFYVLYLIFPKGVQLKRVVTLVLLFTVVLTVSHIPWFPSWIKAYQWRMLRQTFVAHHSIFVPLEKLGIFWPGLPLALTVCAFLFLAFFTVKGSAKLEEVLLLPIVLSIVFNPALTFDRLFVAIFALLLLSQRNSTIVISYFAGLLFISVRETPYAWAVAWAWALSLLISASAKIALRDQKGVAKKTFRTV